MTNSFPILTVIIFLPLLGGFLALCFSRRPNICRWTSLWVTLVDLFLVVLLFTLNLNFQSGPAGKWLLVEDHLWIESLGIRYTLGLDGISLMLILLTAFLTVLVFLCPGKRLMSRVGTFHFFLLFMETSILGVFLAIDLFLFYLFWEIQIIPMFFLIGIWGHEERVYATVKFILFTFSGSLFMLIALIGLYLTHGSQTGQYTFSLYELMETPLPGSIGIWLYAAFSWPLA